MMSLSACSIPGSLGAVKLTPFSLFERNLSGSLMTSSAAAKNTAWAVMSTTGPPAVYEAEGGTMDQRAGAARVIKGARSDAHCIPKSYCKPTPVSGACSHLISVSH